LAAARTGELLCRDPGGWFFITLPIIVWGYVRALSRDIVGDDWTSIGATREAKSKPAEKHQTEHFHW
jgi:hypothetical protein